MTNNILSMEKITKIYSNGVIANKNVNFKLVEGEIHALMGENGAGKSTLMKVLFGMEKPDSGKIEFEGKKVELSSSSDALNLGIGMVHQHFMLVPSLTVTENIVLGMEPQKGLLYDEQTAVNLVEQIAKKYNFDINPKSNVRDISVGQKQKVEILKAVFRNVKLLILDEPTAILTPQETDELFVQLRNMRSNGMTIVFISHKLNEIKALCDRITIMRDGNSMGTYGVDALSEDDITKLMVGRGLSPDSIVHLCEPGEVKLEVKNLSYVNEEGKKLLDNVSLKLMRSEILGIAGIEGSGQSELVSYITGMANLQDKYSKVLMDGEDISELSVRKRRDKHMSYIPADRLQTGMASNMTIKDNLISSYYSSDKINSKIFTKEKTIRELFNKNIDDYHIKCKGSWEKVGMLSGGNMQKVAVARELSQKPDIVIADQPTRGVDVIAVEFIHQQIMEARNNGCAILLVSADLNEIRKLSDKIIVMSHGVITGEFENNVQITEEELGYYMLGIKKQDRKEVTFNEQEDRSKI